MTAKQLKNKLNKKTPLLMSPFGFALAACGGGGGDGGGESGSKPFVWNGASLNKGSLTATTSTLFDRTLDVYGVKLLVGGASGTQDAVPDAWAYKVAQSYVMLMDPTGSNIDVSAQEKMKEILSGVEGTWHEGYGTSQRILKGAFSEYPLDISNDSNQGLIDAVYGTGTEAFGRDTIMQDMPLYLTCLLVNRRARGPSNLLHLLVVYPQTGLAVVAVLAEIQHL